MAAGQDEASAEQPPAAEPLTHTYGAALPHCWVLHCSLVHVAQPDFGAGGVGGVGGVGGAGGVGGVGVGGAGGEGQDIARMESNRRCRCVSNAYGRGDGNRHDMLSGAVVSIFAGRMDETTATVLEQPLVG